MADLMVAAMQVDAAEHPGGAPDDVPLRRIDPGAPLTAEQLGERAAFVADKGHVFLASDYSGYMTGEVVPVSSQHA